MAGQFLAMAIRGRMESPDGQIFAVPPTMNANDCLAIFSGTYEHYETQLLRSWFQSDHTIVEIGANVGVVSRYAFMEKLQEGGSYICVEPNPVSHAALQNNMRRASEISPRKNFSIIAAAICSPKQEATAAQFVVRKNLTSALVGQLPSDKTEQVVWVQSISLSGLLKKYAPKGASLICDAEGAEIPMIFEDSAAFQKINQIAIELHEPQFTGHPETPDIMLRELYKLGFFVRANIGNTYHLAKERLACG